MTLEFLQHINELPKDDYLDDTDELVALSHKQEMLLSAQIQKMHQSEQESIEAKKQKLIQLFKKSVQEKNIEMVAVLLEFILKTPNNKIMGVKIRNKKIEYIMENIEGEFSNGSTSVADVKKHLALIDKPREALFDSEGAGKDIAELHLFDIDGCLCHIDFLKELQKMIRHEVGVSQKTFQLDYDKFKQNVKNLLYKHNRLIFKHIKESARFYKKIVIGCVSTRHSLTTNVLGIFRTDTHVPHYTISLTLALDLFKEILKELLGEKEIELQLLLNEYLVPDDKVPQYPIGETYNILRNVQKNAS